MDWPSMKEFDVPGNSGNSGLADREESTVRAERTEHAEPGRPAGL